MATAKTNRSSFFVSSRGKTRATIPDHRAKARVSTPVLERTIESDKPISRWVCSPRQREIQFLPKLRKTTLTGMAKKTQLTPKSALPVQSLISSRLKFDYLPAVNPMGLARVYKLLLIIFLFFWMLRMQEIAFPGFKFQKCSGDYPSNK
jgi:hypothetical protein